MRLIDADRLKDIISDTVILDQIDAQPTIEPLFPEMAILKKGMYKMSYTLLVSGELIPYLLDILGKTQEQLADDLGVSRSTISKWSHKAYKMRTFEQYSIVLWALTQTLSEDIPEKRKYLVNSVVTMFCYEHAAAGYRLRRAVDIARTMWGKKSGKAKLSDLIMEEVKQYDCGRS